MKKIICLCLSMILSVGIFSFNAATAGSSAQAAIVINGDNGEVIYESNSDARLPMASTTKIMTALLLAEYGNLEREIVVTKEMVSVEGSSMGLLPGDIVTLHDLLYGMMLASGNDAANTTAIVLGGSSNGFSKLMNDKAKEIGLKNTNFVTPSGLDDENHYSTAHDMAILAMYALKNQAFAEAAASKSAILCYGNPPYKRTLTNHNKLLRLYDGAIGVKTGFTKKSGRCLVSAAKRDGKFVIAVTLNDPNDWDDHINLFDYGFSQIKSKEYSPQCSSYIIPVVNGNSDGLLVEIDSFTVNTVSDTDITSKINLPKFLYAPVKSGDIIGDIEYYSAGTLVNVKKITAPVNIQPVRKNTYFQNFIICLKCIISNL